MKQFVGNNIAVPKNTSFEKPSTATLVYQNLQDRSLNCFHNIIHYKENEIKNMNDDSYIIFINFAVFRSNNNQN